MEVDWTDEPDVDFDAADAADAADVLADAALKDERAERARRIEEYRRMPYREYLRTSHWRATRSGALIRAGNRCQLCGSVDRLEVHHRDYSRLGAERDSDLIVLCRPHHHVHHLLEPLRTGDVGMSTWLRWLDLEAALELERRCRRDRGWDMARARRPNAVEEFKQRLRTRRVNQPPEGRERFN